MTNKGDDDDPPEIMPCTNALAKPALTPDHRLSHCLYAMDTKLNVDDLMYDDFYQSVHVDKKWFTISEKQLYLHVVPGKELPNRTCQNKDHIVKVMFF